MRRLLLAVAAASGVLAPARGVAFLRSQSDSGACLAWPQRRVEFVANADGLAGQQPVCGGDGPAEKLMDALDSWNRAAPTGSPACTDIQLALRGETSRTDVGASSDAAANVNLVVWRRGSCDALAAPNDPCWADDATTGCAAKYNCWEYGDDRTIALTTTSYLVGNGAIVDADIELRAWDGGLAGFAVGTSGWYFTCFDPVTTSVSACTTYGESGCVAVDLESVLAHELGHAIGIADQYTSPTGTMYGYASIGETLKRTLAPDDIEAVCTVYPVGESTPQCETAHAIHDRVLAGAGNGGCSSAGSGTSIAALIAVCWGHLRRRSPRRVHVDTPRRNR